MNGKRVLIVDDNPAILKSLSFLLAAQGYQPSIARDGGEAACAVCRERPDLILLDINFPADVGHGGGVPWDGFLIMGWLRKMEEAREVPIIFISGDDAYTSSRKSLAAGAVAFLHKPIRSQELLTAVRQALHEQAPEVEMVG
jgi:CheY-like chemotaxis protein